MFVPRPTILIGPVSDDPAESVSAVNRALSSGLSDDYEFVRSWSRRKHGLTRQSRLNGWNLYYLLKHSVVWLKNLIRCRPSIAHYAISSGWALRKGIFFLKLARMTGARAVGHLHSGGFLDYWNSQSEDRRRRLRAKLRRLDAFVVLSRGWADDVARVVGIPGDMIHVVNNPISAEFEGPALELPVGREGNTVFSLGTMGRDKGVFDLLEAAGSVHASGIGLRVRIAGPEREAGVLKEVRSRMVREGLENVVTLSGRVWGERKLGLFSGAVIFVLPSYYENFPLVLLEAAAAGLPIITTPVGATPEFFTDGESALFVEPGRPDQLADAIKRLMESPAERHRLGGRARAVFQQSLTREAIVRSLDKVYREVL